MKRASAAFCIMAIALCAWSCKSPVNGKGGDGASSAKSITAFTFAAPPATGTIDESARAISVPLPFGTAVTALVPTIAVSEGASVSPASGAAQNFTNPVTYTVTAADGSTQAYSVSVAMAASPANLITSFSFASPAASGAIDEASRAISVSVPNGTTDLHIVPIIAVSPGASVAPASGVAQNFAVPVTYTVTAASGATRVYTVTVTVATANSKAITAFSFASPAATGTIDETNHAIAISVPFGTPLTALVPTIAHSGSSISPASGAPQNFTSPATYTVTAADSSAQEYTVTVTILPASAARDITAFSINGTAGTISGTNISLSLPLGTNPRDLSADFSASPGATVRVGGAVQASGVTSNDFSAAVTYAVTAENGIAQNTYTVTLTVSGFTGQAWTSIDGGGTGGINAAGANVSDLSCASYNGLLYAAWTDSTAGQVHIKKFDGASWADAGESGSKLNTGSFYAGSAYIPSASNVKLIACGGYLYAAWQETDGSNDPYIPGIHVKRYNGSSWQFAQDYSTGQGRRDINKAETAIAMHVDLAVFNGELYATWMENANGTNNLQLRASKFDGALWTSIDGDGQYGLNYNTEVSLAMMEPPTLCSYDGHVYVAWVEAVGTGSQLFAKRYDGGSTWTWVGGSDGVGLNYLSAQQVHVPSLVADDDRMYLFWRESYNGTTNRVRVKQFDGTNWTLDPDGGSGWRHNANTSYSPFGYRFGNMNFVAWAENLSATWQIRVVGFDGAAMKYLDGDGNYGINQSTTMDGDLPTLEEHGGDLYAVWIEDNAGDNNHYQTRGKRYPLPPIVESVDVPASGSYGAGQTLTFTVHFSKAVDVSGGTPSIPLLLQSGTVKAAYTGGSGTSALAFSYVIVSGDSDGDGIQLGSGITGAVLRSRDSSPLPANYRLLNAGATAGVRVGP
jgi:hypothetical protein